MPERRLLDLIAAIHGVLDIGELRQALLQAVPQAVPADWTSLNDIGQDPADAVLLTQPEVEPERLSVFMELAHQNPLLVRWLRTRDGRAYRFSDVASEAELIRLPLFRRFYAPLGIRHQIAFTLPSAADRVLALALSRAHHDFTDLERDLLNQARPFLIQAYRNALEYSRIKETAEPATEATPALYRALIARGLTSREIEVLRWSTSGCTHNEVAEELEISARTVQKHLERAYRKLEVTRRSEAAALLRSLNEHPA